MNKTLTLWKLLLWESCYQTCSCNLSGILIWKTPIKDMTFQWWRLAEVSRSPPKLPPNILGCDLSHGGIQWLLACVAHVVNSVVQILRAPSSQSTLLDRRKFQRLQTQVDFFVSIFVPAINLGSHRREHLLLCSSISKVLFTDWNKDIAARQGK